jgi:hypothetical protein
MRTVRDLLRLAPILALGALLFPFCSKEPGWPNEADVDDFEAAKLIIPLTVNRTGWVQSSIPISILNDPANPFFDDGLPALDERRALARRGRLIWFNPYNGVPIREIRPNRDLNANVSQITTVQSAFNFCCTDLLSLSPGSILQIRQKIMSSRRRLGLLISARQEKIAC